MKQNVIKHLGYNKKYWNENRLNNEDREIPQEENKEIKSWQLEEKYENIKEPIKEIQHPSNMRSRKRKQMGGHYPRNCLRKISTTEEHKFSDLKGPAKWINVGPHQVTNTWHLKTLEDNEKTPQVPEKEENDHTQGMMNHKVLWLLINSTRS